MNSFHMQFEYFFCFAGSSRLPHEKKKKSVSAAVCAVWGTWLHGMDQIMLDSVLAE